MFPGLVSLGRLKQTLRFEYDFSCCCCVLVTCLVYAYDGIYGAVVSYFRREKIRQAVRKYFHNEMTVLQFEIEL